MRQTYLGKSSRKRRKSGRPAHQLSLIQLPIVSSPPRPDKRFLCLPPVDRHTHPRNYVHLVKLLILLYIYQDEWLGVHPFEGLEAGKALRYHIPEFLASSSTTITLRFYPRCTSPP
ncbi:hypothetical protein BDV36DRAFT_245438 [Aspergillus pseudocaelatus]|uniref:Uncharacterized protein n=1 Tax=Aspergillus pseudocaelatus TaxID=1825620 RepID=A0ABQ6X057_9EURO|nr:hypothetical protein BDV36DRAFT_245438 [Aspergillus pseudocaelatus]